MQSSRTITLFTEQPPSRRSPSSFTISIFVHSVALGWLIFGLRHTPRLGDQSLIERYTVRLLNSPRTEQQKLRSTGTGVAHSAPRPDSHTLPPGGRPAPLSSLPQQLAQLIHASQTLVQPDAPPDLLLPQETPIPFVVMWSPENSPSKTIVPPPSPQATAANTRPSLLTPNHELKPADIRISATAFPTQMPTLPPSTTSPLVVLKSESVKQVSQAAPTPLTQPTQARVMSLSDLQLKEGSVAIPLANETSHTASSESLVAGRSENDSEAGNGTSAGSQSGNGAGSGDQGGKGSGGSGAIGQGGADLAAAQESNLSLGSGTEPSVTRISRPKDGQFGVVVVGSSLAEQYPETVGLWRGRLVYTVYLHVGLSRNWVLQYSLPRSAEASVAGNITRPEAPWPYDIVRPHLAPSDYNSDAIMVHGFVNLAGRFERLAVVFPTEFAQLKFVLDALQQWQFRPARQNGQIASVEILLIIPEETE